MAISGKLMKMKEFKVATCQTISVCVYKISDKMTTYGLSEVGSGQFQEKICNMQYNCNRSYITLTKLSIL